MTSRLLLRGAGAPRHLHSFPTRRSSDLWIRQAITRAIADHSRTIRIPVHMLETLNKLRRTTTALVQDLGREPTPEEIGRSEEHTSELQSQSNLVCRLLLEKKKIKLDFLT